MGGPAGGGWSPSPRRPSGPRSRSGLAGRAAALGWPRGGGGGAPEACSRAAAQGRGRGGAAGGACVVRRAAAARGGERPAVRSAGAARLRALGPRLTSALELELYAIDPRSGCGPSGTSALRPAERARGWRWRRCAAGRPRGRDHSPAHRASGPSARAAHRAGRRAARRAPRTPPWSTGCSRSGRGACAAAARAAPAASPVSGWRPSRAAGELAPLSAPQLTPLLRS